MSQRVAETYEAIRLGLFSSGAQGVITDLGLPDGVATVVTLRDGTVSLYFSNGSGLLDLGDHDGPADRAAALLDLCDEFADNAIPAEEFPLPDEGTARFYFLTNSGVGFLVARATDLEKGDHPLSPLFVAVHGVVTAARRVDPGAGKN